MITLTKDQQSDILKFVTTSLDLYESQSQDYREQMTDIYSSLSTFTEPNTGENIPRFKINLMHIFLRQIVPRIIANSPKPLVTPRTDVFFEWDENLKGQDRIDMTERNNQFAQVMQDYLTTVFEQGNMRESLKYWVVNQLTYWNAFAQVVPKYKIQRSKTKTKEWQKVTEKMISVMPSIDIISWSEIFYDPRFKIMEDMPWYFRVRNSVRIRDLIFAKNSEHKAKYFNLDKLEELGNTQFTGETDYKDRILAITGIDNVNIKAWLDNNALTLQIFYWFYTLTGKAKDERIYEITTINNALVIGIEEIAEMPIIDIKWHEDPEIFFSVWLLAPIIGIQDEINFKTNARATATSKALNRSYYWNPDSGVDPSELVGDKAWNIIYAANWVEQAEKNLVEIADRPLDNSYFSDMNDLYRRAQQHTHTVDVTQPQWQTNLTNTATGARISSAVTDAVIDELRKNFERWVQELWFRILQFAFDNIDTDVTIKKKDGKFFKLKKEAFRDALERYDIKIEASSSSFDSADTRRADALAIKNIMAEAKQFWLNVDLESGYKDVFNTFEWVNADELIKPAEESIETLLWGALWEEQSQTPVTEDNLTQQL